MTTRRDAIGVLIGASAAASLPMTEVIAAAEPAVADKQPKRKTVVKPAKLERPASIKDPVPYVPPGEFLNRAADYDYIEEEWFASGQDDTGRPYMTQVVVRRPRDHARFSGTLIVEPLHLQSAAPVYIYSANYILRSGHAWACIASQKMALDAFVKKAEPEHYAALHIESDTAMSAAGPAAAPPADAAAMAAMMAKMDSVNQACNAILAQVGSALRTQGPFADYNVRHVLLVGHSQTGHVTTNFVKGAHESHRRAGGAPVFDGYFPSGNPGALFAPRDVPLVQVVSDGDMASSAERRGHRRPDSDDVTDRYRLYELAGVSHMGTRYPPHSDPRPWSERLSGAIPTSAIMNSLPHDELFNMSLNHLVQWVAKGVTPPRADRLEIDPDGRFIAKDEHGNSRGGVRCAQMDVPRAIYYSSPRKADGTAVGGIVGTEVAFDKSTMQKLYENPTNYVQRFDKRLDELIAQNWLLGPDARNMRVEAQSQIF